VPRGYGALAVVAIVGAGIGACGDDDDRSAGSVADADGESVDVSVDVSDAWARSSPPGVTSGAAYVTIESAAGDRLVGAAVPTDVAAGVQFHETVVGDDAALTMRQVTAVDLASGEAVAFEPGGLHMMLIDLVEPLESGSSFELTLTFAEAAPVTVSVVVRDEAP
jgi:periplasmic copper chaperone A